MYALFTLKPKIVTKIKYKKI